MNDRHRVASEWLFGEYVNLPELPMHSVHPRQFIPRRHPQPSPPAMNANYINSVKKEHFPPRKLLDKPPDDYPHEWRRPSSPGPDELRHRGADMTA
jgi:hypothetical protein